MDGHTFLDSQMLKFQSLNQRIQEIVKKPFTERRMDENAETDEKIELSIALNQIMEYEHMLLECNQNFQIMGQSLKEELEKKDIQVEELINEKDNELQTYIRRCEELQDANNELAQKNLTVLNNLEYLEDELNRQKESQRKLEHEIIQINEAHNQNKEQIRERQVTVQQLHEENMQQSQKQQQVLIKQKTEMFDMQERLDDLVDQTQNLQKNYEESLKEIETLKRVNYSLKEMNEHLKMEIVKILEEKELLFSSDNLDREVNTQNSIQNGEDVAENGISNHFKTAQKEQQNLSGTNQDQLKNQFSTIYGDLMSDLNKDKHGHNPRSSRNQYSHHHHHHQSHNQYNPDVSKFQSTEGKGNNIFNIGNQLSQIKRDESFFEGFNPNTQRSTDSQLSINLISNFLKDTAANHEYLQDNEIPDKLNFSQKNSKSPQQSVRSSFESPRLQAIVAPHQSLNKSIPSNQSPVQSSESLPKLKSAQNSDIPQDPVYQNEIKLDKYSNKPPKGHQRYLSAIPTSKSNSFNESDDDGQEKEESQQQESQRGSSIIQVIKIDAETQTILLVDEKELNKDEQEIEQQKDKSKQENVPQQVESNNSQAQKEDDKICQKCNVIQDPYYVFFILICQTAKMNSKFKDDVIDFDIKQFYEDVKQEIPINQWYKWADDKLLALRKQLLKSIKV